MSETNDIRVYKRRQPTLDERLKRIAAEIETCIRYMDVEYPEDPGFMIHYNPQVDLWYVFLGTRYAGWFEAEAVIPIYMKKGFHSLYELVRYMEGLLEDAEEG